MEQQHPMIDGRAVDDTAVSLDEWQRLARRTTPATDTHTTATAYAQERARYDRHAVVDDVDHGTCQWFALCDNQATTTVAHPVLGDVPICARCLARLGIA